MRLQGKGSTLEAYLPNLRLLKVAGFQAPKCAHRWLVLSAADTQRKRICIDSGRQIHDEQQYGDAGHGGSDAGS